MNNRVISRNLTNLFFPICKNELLWVFNNVYVNFLAHSSYSMNMLWLFFNLLKSQGKNEDFVA